MASGIFALLDDISMLADDVAVASKISAAKTAAILGDDLAVNAQKATGFEQSRELKIIWAITKGSLKNKAIILPIVFALNSLAPSLIVYALVFGGIYLIYEGIEKIHEYIFNKEHTKDDAKLLNSTNENVLDIEAKKIKSAVFTDFILSIEIIIMALSSVRDQILVVQIISTIFVSILATFGVYGIVALIVRMDNLGFWLISKNHKKSGNTLISAMPKFIKILGVVGTFAMLLVGGGILVHNITFFHHFLIPMMPIVVNDIIIGLTVGTIILILIQLLKFIKK